MNEMENDRPSAVIVISANAEWRVVREFYAACPVEAEPYGECFETCLAGRKVVFFQGGWGKIAAASSAQYAIQRWQPDLIVNLGTCGGFAGCVDRGTVLLATETLVYDIVEQMGDAQEAIDHYSTSIDLSWLQPPYPMEVLPARLVSADRDILPGDVKMLREQFYAVAADWESGAIAWVCKRNHVHCLILRGVSDLVAESGGEAYGSLEVFRNGTHRVMSQLLAALPDWLTLGAG